ncbi:MULTISPECIES: GNAT family N-acetyltransferase [unclassified Beijerinckia]|uniref:GNAT family N-acetyltransferase n=1 Tax=unclassified Beijerinckia TaxID=2638183 RepID=UPI00089BDEBB|nr:MULTISPECIES: GNAT family N-acetyltransferase [unclassified Beijerinckia]MDH7794765.1 CelD/BcsL family acetyltransferase involved in cellulose biosynthesis [Beijerinckia sp. GAS462]SEB74331.1 Acetyltransferase involved in cellulose biosynthesis, CelD/BcsL family [Beijerinckia sp. 28-YEA-48]
MSILPRIEIYDDPADVLDAWAELEAIAPASVYQTRRWLLPWIETVCPAAGIRPLLILTRDASGSPLMLLPFGIQKVGGLRLVQFLGGRDSNANLGLYRPGSEPPRHILTAILMQVAQASPLRPDAYVLANQPLTWEGRPNPFAALARQDSPSFCYSTALHHDFDSFAKERLSSDARKKQRWKLRKLEELGQVTYRKATTAEEIEKVIGTYLAQKRARFAQMNIASDMHNSVAVAYFRRSCLPQGDEAPAVELHALYLDTMIVAIYGGGVHRGRFHGMVNSFDMDPMIARSSPGDLLLQRLIEAKCYDGLTRFDLGIGEGRYKSAWCNEAEPLFDTLIGQSGAGQAFVLMEKTRRRAKRLIKQSEWAWPMAKRLRACLGFLRKN